MHLSEKLALKQVFQHVEDYYVLVYKYKEFKTL